MTKGETDCMMKKFLCTLVCLILCLSALSAQAAAVRDDRQMDVQPDQSLVSFASLIAGAALMRGQSALAENETPCQELQEGVFLLLYAMQGTSADHTASVSDSELSDSYGKLFASGAYTPITQPICPCLTRQGDGLLVDWSNLEGDRDTGADIYETHLENGRLSVKADVYTSYYSDLDAEDVPEDGICFEMGMELVLQQNAQSPFGWSLVSFACSPAYQNGALAEWKETVEDNYSLFMPASFELSGATEQGPVYTAENGTVSLTVTPRYVSGNDHLDACLTAYQEAYPDATFVCEPWNGQFTVEQEGLYIICYANDDMDLAYVLTLQFPAERQMEYTFCGEIIRNSFYAAGMPVG